MVCLFFADMFFFLQPTKTQEILLAQFMPTGRLYLQRIPNLQLMFGQYIEMMKHGVTALIGEFRIETQTSLSESLKWNITAPVHRHNLKPVCLQICWLQCHPEVFAQLQLCHLSNLDGPLRSRLRCLCTVSSEELFFCSDLNIPLSAPPSSPSVRFRVWLLNKDKPEDSVILKNRWSH